MLLVVAPPGGVAETIRAMVDPQRFRLLHCSESTEVETVLGRGCVDGCILETDLDDPQPIQTIQMLRKRFPEGPLFVIAGSRRWEIEEQAYLHGATHILPKPVGAALFVRLLERALPTAFSGPVATAPTGPASPEKMPTPRAAADATETLELLRRFSTILAHTLQAESLVSEFLLLLREVLRVNRAAVYLRPPPGDWTLAQPPESARRLRVAAIVGLSLELLRQFDLSLDSGIGAELVRRGRILLRDSPEARMDGTVQREFEMVGAQLAVPILDRESLLGVALFDNRLTSETFSTAELALIFHLFEELGLALKVLWLHESAISGQETLENILSQLHDACLVVNSDLKILHANEAAVTGFGRPDRPGARFDFADLPQPVASKVFEILQTGQPVRRHKCDLPAPDRRSFRVTVSPWQRGRTAAPGAALVLIEESTAEDQLNRLEIETASLRLVKKMAEGLSHEVGNALVPLSTHQQLLDKKKEDPEFIQSLQTALDGGVRRVARLSSQMHFLACDLPARLEAIPLEPMVQEAFREAQRHQPEVKGSLSYSKGNRPLHLYGDRPSLKHALYEVLLNALQASPRDARVTVRSALREDDQEKNWVDIEIADAGPGFTEEVAGQAANPFFTTRQVGLGLGLTVARRIVESHRGQLTVVSAGQPRGGLVRISLPLDLRPEEPSAN